jgi:hypothetical protein
MSQAPRTLGGREGLFSVPNACRHKQLATEKRARCPNQARADHFQPTATLLELKFNRKFAAGMLNRESFHGTLLRVHDAAGD